MTEYKYKIWQTLSDEYWLGEFYTVIENGVMRLDYIYNGSSKSEVEEKIIKDIEKLKRRKERILLAKKRKEEAEWKTVSF